MAKWLRLVSKVKFRYYLLSAVYATAIGSVFALSDYSFWQSLLVGFGVFLTTAPMPLLYVVLAELQEELMLCRQALLDIEYELRQFRLFLVFVTGYVYGFVAGLKHTGREPINYDSGPIGLLSS